MPKLGGEVDQLAIDREGRLAVIELKDAAAAAQNAYYAPLQLLQYVWEWHEALAVEDVLTGVQALIDARVELGLTPRSVPRLTGGIRPVVGFGPDRRSDEVKRRYRDVLEVVNRHLLRHVPRIETWALDDGAARPRPAES